MDFPPYLVAFVPYVFLRIINRWYSRMGAAVCLHMHMLIKLLVKARFAKSFVRPYAEPASLSCVCWKGESGGYSLLTPHSQVSSILLTNPANHNKVAIFTGFSSHVSRVYYEYVGTIASYSILRVDHIRQTFKRNQIVSYPATRQSATCHLKSLKSSERIISHLSPIVRQSPGSKIQDTPP